MLKFFLWLKYLRKKKIFFLSIAAVILSSSLLMIVSNLFGGFIQAFEQAAVDTMGDVVITPPVKSEKFSVLKDSLQGLDSVKAATGTLSGEGLLHLGEGKVKPVKFWGINLQEKTEVTKFGDFLCFPENKDRLADFNRNSSETPGLLGIGVTAEPNELTDEYDIESIKKNYLNKQVILTTGTVSNSAEGVSADRKTIVFNVRNIVQTGIYQFDKRFIYLPRKKVRQLFYPNVETQCVDQIQIKLTNGVDTEDALAQINDIWREFAAGRLGWGDYLINSTTIETSLQMQRSYVTEIRKQMGILLVIFSAVSVSVVVLILCIFYMIVENRKKDIAIFKSFGTPSRTIAAVFIGYAGVLAVAGGLGGMILAWIVTKNINTIEYWLSSAMGLKIWKSSTYLFSRIPAAMNWETAGIVLICSVIAAVIGSLIPAIIAARTRPVNLLRYE
jgi:ABC-type lipoprotein release transport system permease subunit